MEIDRFWVWTREDDARARLSGYCLFQGMAKNEDGIYRHVYFPQSARVGVDWDWTAPAERREAFARLVEQAFTGCPTALKALRVIAASNRNYFEWQDTVKALSS